MTYPTFIDFHKLATDTETLAQTRILAQHMITNNRSYAPPSELLSLLSVVDIELLLGMIENSTDSPTDPWTKQIATMVCVFAQAEGVDLDTIDLSRQYGYFCSIIALVSLARKGFTDLNYENISFVDSKQSNNAVIVALVFGGTIGFIAWVNAHGHSVTAHTPSIVKAAYRSWKDKMCVRLEYETMD